MYKLIILAVLFSSCTVLKSTRLNKENINDYLGEFVTVKGITINAHLGAFLRKEKEGLNIWIDGLNSWPDGFYQGGLNGKTLKVTGTLIEKYDLPVFIPDKNDTLAKHGIPLPVGTDLKKASHRYLLKNAKWKN